MIKYPGCGNIKCLFYTFDGKMLCYLWTNKKTGWLYIGFVNGNKIEHPLLIIEKRARMSILLLDPCNDVPLETVKELLANAIKIKKQRRDGVRF